MQKSRETVDRTTTATWVPRAKMINYTHLRFDPVWLFLFFRDESKYFVHVIRRAKSHTNSEFLSLRELLTESDIRVT